MAEDLLGHVHELIHSKGFGEEGEVSPYPKRREKTHGGKVFSASCFGVAHSAKQACPQCKYPRKLLQNQASHRRTANTRGRTASYKVLAILLPAQSYLRVDLSRSPIIQARDVGFEMAALIYDLIVHSVIMSATAPSKATSHHQDTTAFIRSLSSPPATSGLCSSTSGTIPRNPFCFIAQEELLKCGNIESNPGPNMTEKEMLQQILFGQNALKSNEKGREGREVSARGRRVEKRKEEEKNEVTGREGSGERDEGRLHWVLPQSGDTASSRSSASSALSLQLFLEALVALARTRGVFSVGAAEGERGHTRLYPWLTHYTHGDQDSSVPARTSVSRSSRECYAVLSDGPEHREPAL
ncbi:hypothetical protein HPB50_029637 [Hyalomma asiaticum]|nr:hypothetical protein HPB50_029637 [Hyalomma asiaticum]